MGFADYLYVDPADKWNWILGAFACFLLYWGIKNIVRAMTLTPIS